MFSYANKQLLDRQPFHISGEKKEETLVHQKEISVVWRLSGFIS